MTDRHIPWMKLAALCGAIYGVIELGTWVANQYDGHKEKVERNDSAYVWSLQNKGDIRKLQWKERRDSADILEIKAKKK